MQNKQQMHQRDFKELTWKRYSQKFKMFFLLFDLIIKYYPFPPEKKRWE